MIFKNNDNELFIGSDREQLFSLSDKIIKKRDKELIYDKKDEVAFNAFTNNVERILRTLYILNNCKIPLIYGRVFDIRHKDISKFNALSMIKKEFLVYNIHNLDKAIGKLRGELMLEFILIESKLDIQKIFEFCRENKVKFSIYHFNDIEENAIYDSSKHIHKMYIPNFILSVIEGLIDKK